MNWPPLLINHPICTQAQTPLVISLSGSELWYRSSDRKWWCSTFPRWKPILSMAKSLELLVFARRFSPLVSLLISESLQVFVCYSWISSWIYYGSIMLWHSMPPCFLLLDLWYCNICVSVWLNRNCEIVCCWTLFKSSDVFNSCFWFLICGIERHFESDLICLYLLIREIC